MSISTIDLTLLAVYLLGVVALGTWVGRGTRTVADYALGGRDRPWWLILASIVATETSTVTFLSIPGFAFGRDLTWLQIALGFAIGRVAVAWLLLPAYFEGSLLTAYEVLERRFGGATRRMASAIFVLTRTLADGLRLFLTAIVLQEMTGVPLAVAALVIGVATIGYTFAGGMHAVLWTDLVQLTLYTVGAVTALGVIIQRMPGGWDQVVSIGEAAGRWRVLDLRLDWSEPYGLWAGLIGGAFVALGSHGVDQLMVQRYLCARGLRDARRALLANAVFVVAQFALFLVIGVGLYAFYETFPPAVAFERTDRVFARFILDEMPIGLVGLLLGGVFAAAMSTLSSSLNACATTTANDLMAKPRAGDEAGDAKSLRATRRLTVVFGGLQIAVAIAGQWLTSTVVGAVLGISAFTTGLVLGLFLLSRVPGPVSERAALVGFVTGLVAMSAVFFGTSLAWPWYALLGASITMVAGWLASRILPDGGR